MTTTAIPLLFLLLAAQSSEERLYMNASTLLATYDPRTGERLPQTTLLPLILNQGLIYDEGRLYTQSANIAIQRDEWVEIEPATGRWQKTGLTGDSLQWIAWLAKNPTNGRFIRLSGAWFFEIDKDTGHATFLSRLDPQIGPSAMAIDSTGRTIVHAGAQVPDFQAKFILADPDTGHWSTLGLTPQVNFLIRCMAFDRDDTLWAIGSGGSPAFDARLFTVDLETFELTPQFPIPGPYNSMAFGPAPDVEDHCTSARHSGGCEPLIDWAGHPSASAWYGFDVTATDVRNDSLGLLWIGLGGRASQPFRGGTLCVEPPWLWTTPQDSGGSGPATSDCSGTWSLDVNTWLIQNQPLPAGTSLNCQWWGRDPGAGGTGQHSAALEVVLME